MNPSHPARIARHVETALRCRRDVTSAIACVDLDDRRYLMIRIGQGDKSRTIEAELARICDGRAMKRILDDWLGPEPAAIHPVSKQVAALRESLLAPTPLQRLLSGPRPANDDDSGIVQGKAPSDDETPPGLMRSRVPDPKPA